MGIRLLAGVLSPLMVVLGPHLFALLGLTIVITAVLGLGYCIAKVAAETGMGVIPVARARSS